MLSRLGHWYRSTWGHAAVGAALLWAALPPVDFWLLAWIAPIWWVLLIRRDAFTERYPYRSLWGVGFLFWLAAIHWLRLPHPATAIGWVALSFYLGFYLPAFFGLTRIAVHRIGVSVIVSAPVVWTGLELVRAHLLTGFTMAELGHTQYRWIHLIQLSDITGSFGIGFVVMFAAACVARMISFGGRRVVLWPLVPLVGVIALVLSYGYWRVESVSNEETQRIALVQGSIDSVLKSDPTKHAENHLHYLRLSEQAVREHAPLDLIVWPETMFLRPLYSRDTKVFVPEEWDSTDEPFEDQLDEAIRLSHEALASMADHLDTDLLFGVSVQHFGSDRVRFFNSAVHVSRDGQVMGHYDKHHLVMFGEYVPFAQHFTWIQGLTPLPISLDSGECPVAFDLDGIRLAPNICYESVLSHVIRSDVNTLMRDGLEPDVLINLTNDGWFWGSSELDMHLACGVFRAVECRKPFLIAANTGFSAVIDAEGRVLSKGPRRDTDVLVAEVGPSRRNSFYLRWGDWPAGICLIGCLLLAAVGVSDRFRHSRRAAEERPKSGQRAKDA